MLLQHAPAAHAYASGRLTTAPKGVPAGATAEAAGSELARPGDAMHISEENKIKLEPASEGELLREIAKLKEQLRQQEMTMKQSMPASGGAS